MPSKYIPVKKKPANPVKQPTAVEKVARSYGEQFVFFANEGLLQKAPRGEGTKLDYIIAEVADIIKDAKHDKHPGSGKRIKITEEVLEQLKQLKTTVKNAVKSLEGDKTPVISRQFLDVALYNIFENKGYLPTAVGLIETFGNNPKNCVKELILLADAKRPLYADEVSGSLLEKNADLFRTGTHAPLYTTTQAYKNLANIQGSGIIEPPKKEPDWQERLYEAGKYSDRPWEKKTYRVDL